MRKKIKEVFYSILQMSGDPKKIALGFALGIFVAFFPIVGTHTVLALGLAWLFRVSPIVTLGASWVNNPWTMAPLFGGCLYLGVLMTGTDITEAHINWSALNWATFVKLVKVIGVPFVVGCLVAGAVASVLSYFVILRMVVAYRARAAARGAM